jgi:hypothetical protein
LFTPAKGYFSAKAIGPNGVYEAGKSPVFDVRASKPWFGLAAPTLFMIEDSRRNRGIHEGLIAIMLKDGWEPVEGKGSGWWGRKFRRRVK